MPQYLYIASRYICQRYYIETTYSYSDNDLTRNSNYNFNGAYLTQKSVSGTLDADGMVGTITETYQYDNFGNLVKYKEPKGYETNYQYDLLNRVKMKANPDGTSVNYTYNDTSNTIKVKNENNVEIEYMYDEFGNLLYEKDITSGEYLKQFHYDDVFRLEWEKNNTSCADYYKIDYVCNDDGRIKSKTTCGKNGAIIAQEKYLYEDAHDLDGNGTMDCSKMTRMIIGDANSPTITTTQYTDRQGYIIREGKIFSGEELYTSYKNDFAGNRIEEKSARANKEGWAETYTTRFEYDHAGRLTKAQDIKGYVSTITYDALGQVVAKTDNSGNQGLPIYSTNYVFDIRGKVIQETIPFEKVGTTIYNTIKKYYYDANGNLTLEKVNSNKSAQTTVYKQTGYDYDNRNRLVKVTLYDNGSPENYTQFYYDNIGNKVRMYTGLNTPLTINGLDNVTGSEPDYSITKYQYNRFSQLTGMTDPLNQTESYTYDLNGNLTEKTDGNGNTISMTYDGLGRILSKSAVTQDGTGNETYSYSYTLTGNIFSSTGSGNSSACTYDALGRLISKTETGGIEKIYTYDAENNRKSFILKQNGAIKTNTTYEYDTMNRLWKVYEGGTLTATYGYDANGNRQTLVYSNGDSSNYTYNLANRLESLTNKKGTATLSSYTYAYYLDGNQATKTDHAGKITSYVYDDLGRLESEAPQGEGSIVYTYDDYNNRATMTVSGVATSYTYDKNNRLKVQTKTEDGTAETTRYYYDNNGNQTCKTKETAQPATGDSSTFEAYILEESENQDIVLNEYDGFNQLKKVTTGGLIDEYKYNADGLRISRKVNNIETRHIWDGDQIVLELDGAGAVTNKYVRGINLIYSEDGTGANKRYFLYNGHGDTVQLTDTSGNIVKSYDYDAFGNEKNPDPTDNNPFRYCGEYFDKETGTYYLRARYYNPGIGRFITEDSYLGDPNDPLSLNLYTYCGNNPIYFIDPTGHKWTDSSGRTYCDVYVFIAGKDRIERANSMMRDPSFYNVADWATDGIWGKAVDVVTINEGDKWYQTTLDTLELGSDLYGRYVTVKLVSSLVDKAKNAILSLFKGASKTNGTGSNIKFGSDTKSTQKLSNQMNQRGWTENTVKDTVSNSYTTRLSTNKATGNSATVYYNQSGGYVIIDDVTKAVVQVSDNINPSTWIPDPSIINPYKP